MCRLAPVGGVIGQKPSASKLLQAIGQLSVQPTQLPVQSQVNEPGRLSVYWRDASLNRLGCCIGGMHLVID